MTPEQGIQRLVDARTALPNASDEQCLVAGCTRPVCVHRRGIEAGLCFSCKASRCTHCGAYIYVRFIPYVQRNRRRSCDACQRLLRVRASQARKVARLCARPARTCVVCGTEFQSQRSTRLTCSGRCRVQRFRNGNKKVNSVNDSLTVTHEAA